MAAFGPDQSERPVRTIAAMRQQFAKRRRPAAVPAVAIPGGPTAINGAAVESDSDDEMLVMVEDEESADDS